MVERKGYVSCLSSSSFCSRVYMIESTLVVVQCVQNCCSKFMRGSARVGQRFGELSAEAENQMQQLMKQQK